eukprot:3925116-Prymnesium_polylepis.1
MPGTRLRVAAMRPFRRARRGCCRLSACPAACSAILVGTYLARHTRPSLTGSGGMNMSEPSGYIRPSFWPDLHSRLTNDLRYGRDLPVTGLRFHPVSFA